MDILKLLEEGDFEEIRFMQDKATGFKAVTVIHNSTLGPCLGGARYWEYATEEEGIIDAMRLARGMTYKNAACGVHLGGGKTVIFKDPNHPKTEEYLRVFGRFVDGLNGRYITAEDVGTTTEDMDIIYHETPYVGGTSLKKGSAGNPSPATAHGVYFGMKAAAKEAFGSDSLKDLRIILEGCGNVGIEVAKKALAEGAKVYASDIFEVPIERARQAGCEIIDRDKLFSVEADIYAPCALGATVNDKSIEDMKNAGIKIVAGSANNQLAEERHGAMLQEAGIIYAPDFIINAGGVIAVADEFNDGFDQERVYKSVEGIYDKILRVFEIAKRDKVPTNIAANILAEERLDAVLKSKRIFRQHERSIYNR